MKKISLLSVSGLLLTGLLFTQCQLGARKNEIVLSNTSSIDLSDKAISIKRSQIPNLQEGNRYPLIISEDGDTIPSQMNDLNSDQTWDELFFVVDMPANETKHYSLEWVNAMPHYLVRTSARFGKRNAADIPVQPAVSETLYANDLPKSIGFQRYQTDGPSWENDKVGFRHYLDGRNAKDLFGKRISSMSPENVGINAAGAVEDNYHVMADWGRDILSVGNSVGLGGYALMVGDQLMRLGVTANDSINNVDKTTFRIIAEGPVKSVLRYQYEKWQPDYRNYSVEETTSIWPGMYAYQNSVKFSGLRGDEELAIGLVNINNQNPVEEFEVNHQWVVLLTHDQQTYNREWWLGMALILPRNIYLDYTEAPKSGQLSNSYLAKLKVENEVPVKYYAVAGWELSDERFKDPTFFKEYVTDLTRQLSAEVEVTVQ